MGSFAEYLTEEGLDKPPEKRPRRRYPPLRRRHDVLPDPPPEPPRPEGFTARQWPKPWVGHPSPPITDPPPPSAPQIVRGGIERVKTMDEKWKRPLDEDYLDVRMHNVHEAITHADTAALRASLIDLAALAEAWAARLPGARQA